MVNDSEPRLEVGTPLPWESFRVKFTVGLLPAVPPVMLVRLTARPESILDSVGTVCPPLMEASKSSSPCGIWQLAHWASSICGPPAWLTPEAKLTSSWQEPQAARDGCV